MAWLDIDAIENIAKECDPENIAKKCDPENYDPDEKYYGHYDPTDSTDSELPY